MISKPDMVGIAAKLTKADKPKNGGNDDNNAQWEEAASALDTGELRSFVEFAMNHVPNPLLRAKDLYGTKAAPIVKQLQKLAKEAADKESSYSYPGAESWAPAYLKAQQLAADLAQLIPAGHPARAEASKIHDYIDDNWLFTKHPKTNRWWYIARDYTKAAEMIENLAYFLPR